MGNHDGDRKTSKKREWSSLSDLCNHSAANVFRCLPVHAVSVKNVHIRIVHVAFRIKHGHLWKRMVCSYKEYVFVPD